MAESEPRVACLVCGEATKNTCSSCRKFGIDLGFCSREHQRIAWSEHKKVCGENANPFRWPLLSPDETQAAIDNVDYLFIDPNTIEPPSLNTYLRMKYGVPREKIRDLIGALSEPRQEANLVAFPMDLDEQQAFLGTVRAWEMQRLNNLRERSGSKQKPTALQLAAMTNHDLFGPAIQVGKHITLTRHRLLFHFAVSRAIQAGKVPPLAAPWKLATMKRLLYAVCTDDWSEASDPEREWHRRKFSGNARELLLASGVPDQRDPDLKAGGPYCVA